MEIKLGKRYVPKDRGDVYYDYIIPMSFIEGRDNYVARVVNGNWRVDTVVTGFFLKTHYKLEKPITLENK